jgi:hypothetical protein
MEKIIVDSFALQGGRHLALSQEGQDFATAYSFNNHAENFLADGHGGKLYLRSALGAKLACQAGKAICDGYYLSRGSYFSGIVLEQEESFLKRRILEKWNESWEKDYKARPDFSSESRYLRLNEREKEMLLATPRDLYGTTFLAFVSSPLKEKNLSLALKLGDGDMVFIFEDGSFRQYPELQEHFADPDLTSSMASIDALDHFGSRAFVDGRENGKRLIGVFLTSDGLRKLFDDEKGFYSFIAKLLSYYLHEDAQRAHEDLRQELERLVALPSSDDLSLSFQLQGDFFLGKENFFDAYQMEEHL